MGRRRDRRPEGLRPVEPGEVRARGNDPNAVRTREEGEVHGAHIGSRTEERSLRGPRSYEREGTGRGTSWLSVIFGWFAALGAALILSGIVGAVLGAGGGTSATEGGASGLMGLLISLLLAFLIGGYVAGRMASRSGLEHGLLVPVLALVVTIVLAGIGALLGLSFIDNLSGVTLPDAPNEAPQNLGTILTDAGILALLTPLIGGAIGGALGASTGRKRP